MAAASDAPAASLTIAAWPGLDLPSLVGDGYALGRPHRLSGHTSTLDTADHRLARAGVVVDKDGDEWAMLVGAYGERRFPADGEEPPAALLAALAGVARGAPLSLAMRQRRTGRWLTIDTLASEDAPPETVGRAVDEDVSILDGRRVVSRHRYVTIEGTHELVAHVRRRLAAHGMADRAVEASRTSAPLGPPDPMPWPLDDRPDAATVVQRALARSVARFLAHDPVVRLDLDTEGVHQMRVAIRRVRSDLRTFGDLLADLPAGLEEDLRWLGGLLGEVRDPDVLRGGLADAIERLEPVDRRFTNSLVKRLARERDAAATRLEMAMESERYHHLVEALVDLANRPPFTDEASKSARTVLLPGAQRAWRRLRAAARRAHRSHAVADDVHALRIRAKRFRYALDALVDVEPAAAAHAALLADLQDVLGEFNDAVVAETWLRTAAANENDPRRMFVLGQLVMAARAVAEERRSRWGEAWKPIRRRKHRAWLDR